MNIRMTLRDIGYMLGSSVLVKIILIHITVLGDNLPR